MIKQCIEAIEVTENAFLVIIFIIFMFWLVFDDRKMTATQDMQIAREK